MVTALGVIILINYFSVPLKLKQSSVLLIAKHNGGLFVVYVTMHPLDRLISVISFAPVLYDLTIAKHHL